MRGIVGGARDAGSARKPVDGGFLESEDERKGEERERREKERKKERKREREKEKAHKS